MKKIGRALLVILSIFTAAAMCIGFCFAGEVQSLLPKSTQMNYNQNSGKTPLKISDMGSLTEKYSLSKVAFYSELEETETGGQSITVVLTNENCFKNYNYRLDGEDFSLKNIQNKSKSAVISEKLALELYFNTDCIGKEIELYGERYTVTGVYGIDDNFLNNICRDGRERVYVPYSSYSGYSECEVQMITYKNESYSAPLIQQMDLSQYYFTNFSEKSKVLNNFVHIMLLCMFILFGAVTLKVWYNLCGMLYSKIRCELKDKYFWHALKSKPLIFVAYVLLAAGVPVLLVLAFMSCDFSIYIISGYVPYDNIFDISHYMSEFTAAKQAFNSLALSGDRFLLLLYAGAFKIMLWITIISALLLTPVFAGCIMYKKQKRG